MATVIEMPRLSDTMQEGVIANWKIKVGDSIAAGDEIAEIETDKAIQEFAGFDDGVVLALIAEPGEVLPIGAPIAIVGKKGEDISALQAELASKSNTTKPIEPETKDEKVSSTPAKSAPTVRAAPVVEPVVKAPIANDAPLQTSFDDNGVRIKASPVARRIAAEHGVDLATVVGTGPQGRIIKRDVEGLDATRHVISRVASKADELIRVTQMRKTIAKRLVESKQTIPHYYLNMEIEADALVAFRKQLNEAQTRIKLSYNDLIMQACVVALQDHPEVNSGWEGEQIRKFGGVHLGFAVALEQGLITPVVKHAEGLTLLQLAQQVRDLADRAREQKLDSSDYSGNSFCVSNLGMFGIERFTAIINPPAACILAVGALRQEAVVRNGELAMGHRLTLSLSCDHRVVDGAMGSKFLVDLKAILENPLAMLLGN